MTTHTVVLRIRLFLSFFKTESFLLGELMNYTIRYMYVQLKNMLHTSKLHSALLTGIVRSNASTLIGFLTPFQFFPLKKWSLIKERKKSYAHMLCTCVVFRYFGFRGNDWNSDYFRTQQFHERSKIQQTEIRDWDPRSWRMDANAQQSKAQESISSPVSSLASRHDPSCTLRYPIY